MDELDKHWEGVLRNFRLESSFSIDSFTGSYFECEVSQWDFINM